MDALHAYMVNTPATGGAGGGGTGGDDDEEDDASNTTNTTRQPRRPIGGTPGDTADDDTDDTTDTTDSDRSKIGGPANTEFDDEGNPEDSTTGEDIQQETSDIGGPANTGFGPDNEPEDSTTGEDIEPETPDVGGPANTEFDQDNEPVVSETGEPPQDQSPEEATGSGSPAFAGAFDSTNPEYEGEMYSGIEDDIIEAGGSDIEYAEVEGGLVARYEVDGQTQFAPVTFDDEYEEDLLDAAESLQEDANEQAVADQIEGVEVEDIRFVGDELSRGSQEEIGQAALADEIGAETVSDLQLGEDFTYDTQTGEIELTPYGEKELTRETVEAEFAGGELEAGEDFTVTYDDTASEDESATSVELTEAGQEALADQQQTLRAAASAATSDPGELARGVDATDFSVFSDEVAAIEEQVESERPDLEAGEDFTVNINESGEFTASLTDSWRGDQAAGKESVEITRTVFKGPSNEEVEPQTGEEIHGRTFGADADRAATEEPAAEMEAVDAEIGESQADAETFGAEVPDLEDVTAQTAIGQQSVGGLDDQVLGPSAKPGGQGVVDFLEPAATPARTLLNPGAADIDLDDVKAAAGGVGSAAAFQFSPFLAAGDDVADAVPVEEVVPDDIEDTVTEGLSRTAVAASVYGAPFVRAKEPAADVATDVADASVDVGADALDAGGEAIEGVDDATEGKLRPVAEAVGTPAINTLLLGGQGAEGADTAVEAADTAVTYDEADFERTADDFVENVTEGHESVVGGPLPVFSVASPGGAQTFLSGSDDALSAAQVADDAAAGSAGAGGTASGGTGTAAAAATDGAIEAATLATSGAFVDELDIEGGEMFVDEQEVTGTQDVFPDEMPIPDPQQIDVGPLGVPELGVQIGPSENQANTEIDELPLPSDSEELFVDEVDVTPSDEATDLPAEASTAVGTGGGVGVGDSPGTGVGPGSTPGTGSLGDTGEGGGFDVGGRPSPGLSIGSDSGVRFVGRTPNPESTLTDAEDEFFDVGLDDPFTGADIIDSAQQSFVGGDSSGGGFVTAASESSFTSLFDDDDDLGTLSETGPGNDVFDGSENLNEVNAPGLTDVTEGLPNPTDTPGGTGQGLGLDVGVPTDVNFNPNRNQPLYEFNYPTQFQPRRPRRPPKPPRIPPIDLPDPMSGSEDDRRRKDSKFSDVFENPSISPEEALGFTPTDTDSDDSSDTIDADLDELSDLDLLGD